MAPRELIALAELLTVGPSRVPQVSDLAIQMAKDCVEVDVSTDANPTTYPSSLSPNPAHPRPSESSPRSSIEYLVGGAIILPFYNCRTQYLRAYTLNGPPVSWLILRTFGLAIGRRRSHRPGSSVLGVLGVVRNSTGPASGSTARAVSDSPAPSVIAGSRTNVSSAQPAITCRPYGRLRRRLQQWLVATGPVNGYLGCTPDRGSTNVGNTSSMTVSPQTIRCGTASADFGVYRYYPSGVSPMGPELASRKTCFGGVDLSTSVTDDLELMIYIQDSSAYHVCSEVWQSRGRPMPGLGMGVTNRRARFGSNRYSLGDTSRRWCSGFPRRFAAGGCRGRKAKPPPTTSPCSGGRWTRCRRPTGRTRVALPGPDSGALRFRGRHPHLRRRVPGRRGGVLLRRRDRRR